MNSLASAIGNVFEFGDVLEDFARWTPRLLSAFLILLVYWGIWRFIRRGLEVFLRRGDLDATIGSLVHSTARLILLSIGIVSALGHLGIDIAGLLTGLGVVGLTVGFAAKDALSNMISGFFILWDRPFTIGDLVEIGDSYGRVDSITLRSTRVVTVDGRMLAIPNTEIINKTVASYTNFPHLRLDIAFTVAVHEDLGAVRRAALSVCENDAALMTDPPPAVVVTALNDYNVALELRVWLRDERSHIPARLALRERLFEALRAAEIAMPFETFALAPIEIRSGTPADGTSAHA
jgi:small conductance mechanosensitive channel